jgi:hypothetical protein
MFQEWDRTRLAFVDALSVKTVEAERVWKIVGRRKKGGRCHNDAIGKKGPPDRRAKRQQFVPSIETSTQLTSTLRALLPTTSPTPSTTSTANRPATPTGFARIPLQPHTTRRGEQPKRAAWRGRAAAAIPTGLRRLTSRRTRMSKCRTRTTR